MSIPVSVMTVGRTVPSSILSAYPQRHGHHTVWRSTLSTVPFTVPLLCSSARARLQVKRPHQVQRRLSQGQATHRRPQVEDVPLLPTLRLEALEHVLHQIHAERLPSSVAAMNRTGAATLQTTAAQTR